MARKKNAAARRSVPVRAARGKVAPGAATAVAAGAALEPGYLQSRRIEDIAQAFLALASELWIVKDRMAVLEQVLDQHGIPAPRAVDAYAPEGEFRSKLDAERRAWAQRMVASLFPRGLPKVD